MQASPLRSPARATSGEDGYTLLELLVVLAILGLLVALAAPRVMSYFSRSKTSAAQVQISSIETALDLYRLDVGTYPTTDQGLKALIDQPTGVAEWHGPYLTRRDGLDDPWGRPYLYAPSTNGVQPVVSSLGADGKVGGDGEDADITSQH